MKEQLVLLRNRERYEAGLYNPLDAKEYLACEGFEGLKRALKMSSDEIIEEVKKSGLRGRGSSHDRWAWPVRHRPGPTSS